MNVPFGYVIHKIIEDKLETLVDYEFLDTNPVFENLIGFKKEELAGKTVSELFPEADGSGYGWRNLYNRVAAEKNAVGFEHYLAATGKWYLVNALRTDDTHLAITLTEFTAGMQTTEQGWMKDMQQHAFWDNNLFGVMIADNDGNYVDANQEACRMTGYSREELRSIKLFQIVDPECVNDANIHFEQIGKTGRAYGEVAYYTKSGEKRWWNVVATRLSSDYFLGLHEDITSRKQMEQELSQNVELNKKLLASIPDIVVQTNLEGIITFVNEPALIDYPFITSELLLGRSILSFVAPHDRSRMEENVRLTLIRPLGIKEYTLHFGERMELICEANGDVLRDEHGNPTGMVFVIRDITKRKKAEQALAKSEERFRLMIKNISAIIVTIDKDGIQQFVSPVAKKITGYTAEELTGKSMSEVIHPDDLPLVMKAWEDGTGNANKEITVQYRHIHKTKGWVYLETKGQSFLNEPAVNAVIAIVHDITGRKQAEEALLLREERLQKQNDTLLAQMSKGAIFQPDLQKAISEITETCSKLVGTERVSVWLYNNDFSEIKCTNLYNGTTQQHLNNRETLRCEEFPAYFACQKRGEVIDAVDVYTDPRTSELPASYYNEHNIRSMLDTPVWFHDRLGAVLCFEHTGEQRVWTSEDVRLATSMAALLSLCFQDEERRQAEEDLKVNQEKLSLVIELAPDAYLQGDKNGNIIGANYKAFEMFDYSKEELLTKNIKDLFPHEVLEDKPLRFDLINAGTTLIRERQLRKKNGELINIEMNSNAMPDGTYQTFIRDITERKKAEASLKEKELKFRTLFENSSDAIFIMKGDTFIECNSATLEVYGCQSTDQILGKTPFDFSPANQPNGRDSRECALEIIDAAIAGTTQFFEWTHTKLDGSPFTAEVRLNKLELNGQILVQAIVRDITERKKSEAVFQDIIDKNPISIQILDLEGYTIQTNSAHTKLFGIKPPANYSMFCDTQLLSLGFGETFENIKKGETVYFPDTYYNVNQVDPSFPDNPVWIKAVGFPLNDMNGKPEYFVLMHENITARKKAEDELQIRERRFSQLIQNSYDAIVILDSNGIQRYVSPSAEKVHGYSSSELVDIPVIETMIHPDDQAKVLAAFMAIIETGSGSVQYRHRHKAGGWVFLEAYGTKQLENPDIKGVVVNVRDITDRKGTEEKLKASEKKFRELSTLLRLMTDNMPDMLWAKNLDKEYIFANKAICNNLLSAVDTNEPLGKNDMFFAMRQRNSQPENPAWHTFGEICRDSDSITLEEMKPMQFHEFGNVKGKFLFLDVHKAPLYDDNDQVIGVVGSARDITERKMLEENLNYQTRLRELLMEISSGFVNIPLDKVDESLNEALRKMGLFVKVDRAYTFDYDWERSVCNNTHEWCNEGVSKGIQRLQNVPITVMIEAVEEHKRGRTVYVPDVNAMPEGSAKELIDLQGVLSFIMVPMMNQRECIGFVGFDSVKVQRDYSPAEIQLLEVFAQLLANVKLRKEMVVQLVAAKEKAEEGDRLKSAFLANMSHEIRTPMNGILGFAELLKEPGLDGDEQQKYIEIIEKSGNRMLNIINDIIDISKIEAGLMKFHFTESNVTEQLEYIHTFFKPEASAKGLILVIKNSLTRGESKLTTDREKLYAILTNLVKNAIKYTEKGEIELGCNHKGQFIEFYVKDSGIGIPENRQKAVFERFIQADIEDKMARQGAGLGLAITKAYVEMLGGSLWLKSKEGVGSTFYFTLPYNVIVDENHPNLASSPIPDAEPLTRHLKILLVEDDAISEMLLARNLKKIAKAMLKAHTGIEAVEMMRANPDVDLVLLDIRLPKMDGYEATRQIRQFNEKVVIIAQTAYGLAGDRESALQAGCNDYIAKPVSQEEMHKLINKYFG